MSLDHLEARGLEANERGLPPLSLDNMGQTSIPQDFEFEGVFGNILMCEAIDENDHGEVLRNGIWLKPEVTQKLWRRGRVILLGPDCKGLAVGDHVAYPSDRGLPMVSVNKKKYIFLSMDRLFGKLKPIDVNGSSNDSK